MNDEDLIRALVRLDDAVKALESRLPEKLATTPAQPPATIDDGSGDPPYDDLKARHAALRERTAAAVDRLTRLVDRAGGA